MDRQDKMKYKDERNNGSKLRNGFAEFFESIFYSKCGNARFNR
jgi:hypothetical protein